MTCTTTYFAFDIHNTHFALHISLHTLHVYDFNLKIAKTGITLFYVRINLCSLGIQIKIMLQTVTILECLLFENIVCSFTTCSIFFFLQQEQTL